MTRLLISNSFFLQSDFLSVEKLLIHTVHIRTKHKLQELCEVLKPLLGLPDCKYQNLIWNDIIARENTHFVNYNW